MELSDLIELLSDPAAYPHPVAMIEVRQTHISTVFLAGDFVYKLKKPVALGFLDFTTLEKRLHFCREEVRLNRRLAPDVYLDVVPITPTDNGVRVGGEGEVIEWAVKMRRLPNEATFLQRVQRGTADAKLAESIASRIADFHRNADTSERIASFGHFDIVARNILDVFERASPTIEGVSNRDVFNRTRLLAEESLTRLRPLIDSRANRGVTRDCHGDLHLDHVYCFPGEPPPGDLIIIDCIEFNEQFRCIDPIADMAFAVMDLAFIGRRDLAQAFTNSYFRSSRDDEGRNLLPLYMAYRAAVRGMVDGLLLTEKEVPENERTTALIRARAHWLLALTELESPGRRPCLLLVAGLPGSGKSTLARMLAEAAGFDVIRSDVVRKELAGLMPTEPSSAQVRESLYSTDSTNETYAECLRQTAELLIQGRRVLVDATFREERHRWVFCDAAVQRGIAVVMLVCELDAKAIRQRLDARKGDASDADWDIYQRVAAQWEEPSKDTRCVLRTVSTQTAEHALAQSLDILRQADLS
ncbi:MAG: AAA family ATPase [Planctomycetes bacterium]|nr:AAA family ATPase [Planctomycetota bacterium]